MDGYVPQKITEVRDITSRPGLTVWRRVANLGEVKEGDVFRMFELDGTPVDFDGEVVFYAMDPPVINSDGRYSVGMCPLSQWEDYERRKAEAQQQ